MARSLERLGRLEEDAVTRTESAAHHDRHGRSQPEGTRATDHQDGHATRDGRPHICPDGQPRAHRDERDHDDDWHEDARHAVGHLGDRRLARRGVADHAYDLRQRRVAPDALRPATQIARTIDRSSRDAIARRLVYGQALARQRRLIYGRRALGDDAVHGDMLAGAHSKRVADAHLLDGHRHLAAIAHQRGRLRSQPHEALQRVRRPTLSARLEQLAERDER